MVPWISDARLVFLVWFVSIAVIVAVLLIFAEIKFKQKKAREAARRREKTPVERMEIILNKEGDIRRKFSIVDKTAKNYFKEEYGMASELDYSELAKRFKMRGKVLEAEFCKRMFELYYSNKTVTEKGVEELGEMLVEMDRKKKFSKDISRVPGVWERIDRVIGAKGDIVVSSAREHVASLKEKLERKTRTGERREYELLSWVKKAIRMGHSKKVLFGLLKNGGKSSGEIRQILKVYDRESALVSRKNGGALLYGGDEGVAQRVIQREKDKLEGMEAASS